MRLHLLGYWETYNVACDDCGNHYIRSCLWDWRKVEMIEEYYAMSDPGGSHCLFFPINNFEQLPRFVLRKDN